MADNLLDVMTTSVNGIQDAVKTVGNDVENAIQNLNDDAKASHYIRILKAKLTGTGSDQGNVVVRVGCCARRIQQVSRSSTGMRA